MQMNACGGAVSVMMVVITVVMAIVMVIAIVFVTCSPDYQATVPNAHDEETGHPRPIKVSDVSPTPLAIYALSLLGGGAPL